MTAAELLNRCAAASIALTAEAGRLRVAGPAKAVREFTPLLREHRDELLGLLVQGVVLNSDPRRAEGPSAAPDPSRGATDPGGPSDWQTADRTYQRHHWACHTCASAGLGYGSRCPEGARLWATYADQPSPASLKPKRQPQAVPRAGTPPHPFERERQLYWTPADRREIERMAAEHVRAVALGLDVHQADYAADIQHWGRRVGDDRRLCLECRHLRAGASSRWHCAAQRQPLPQQLVAEQPHRCPIFRDAFE